jgi:hypothetical protein
MKLPFLRYLPGLGSPPVRQVAGSPGAPATAALHYLLAELPELLLAAVLDLPTGQLVATYAAERSYQPSLLAAPVAAVVKLLQQQSPAPEQPAEVLLTLASQLHLVRLRPGSAQVLFLAIGSHDTNLALLRQLADHAVQLLAAPAERPG